MSTNLIASLRQQLPSIYGEHLPDEIRYRRADGQDVPVRWRLCPHRPTTVYLRFC